MARPKKNNADYISHDNDARNHRKIKALRNRYGVTGYGFWFMLLEFLTYSDYNQFEFTDSEVELMAQKQNLCKVLSHQSRCLMLWQMLHLPSLLA